MTRREALIERASEGFERAFGDAPERVFAAPGRVNLIGEHVDYNDGLVLPCAINRDTIVVLGSPRANGGAPQIEAVALDIEEATCRFRLDHPIERGEADWHNLVRGAAFALQRLGHTLAPARLAIAGDVPIGAGLSSSASFAVGVTLALAKHAGLDLIPREIAEIAREAENDFVGVPCGIMDQMASAASAHGSALMLDCRSMDYAPAPISETLAIVIIDSGIRRQLSTSAFAERRHECEAAALHYGVASLRDLTPEALEAERGGLDPVLFQRARHVVSEIARVKPAASALARGHTGALWTIMRASHLSLRKDFEVSLEPIDRCVDIVVGALGDNGGVRLTGAGFGGCMVAVCTKEACSDVIEAVEKRYNPGADIQARADIYTPQAGAHEVTPGV